ncbi:MAG TPA: sigma-70 family RNA polymerase sigma factor [Tepidisphaeraceae bacterium]
MAEFARQMEFTPQDVRLAQVNAAEDLLHTIDPNKAYPCEFLVFRITGYHPKTLSDELLAGAAVQHDLGLLIEQISDTLDVRTEALSQPVLSIEDVTERFNVTSKTIQRWRRKGLPGRRFVFPDGKRRVGFLLSSVERFLAAHREQVARGTNFSQIDERERDAIVRRARRLAGQCGCCSKEIARRIARKLGRSPLTILHTIRKFDQEHPAEAVFPQATEAISDAERQRILRGFRRGMSLKSLAKKTCRTRSAIYRVIVDERIERLNRRKAKFIDDSLYHQDDAADLIRQLVSQEELAAQTRPEDLRIPRDLPPYLQDLYRTPLLTPAKERALFLKFNFHKFQFVTARRNLEPQFAKLRHLEELEGYLRAAIETKNAILRANLRLVVSVARKHLRPGVSIMELISDGNITLMRAVEGFDVHRGHRFSTYATLALMKGFARSVPQMLSAKRTTSIEEHILESVPDRDHELATDRLADREHVGVLLSRLSESERRVLSAHYGLGNDSGITFDEVGERLGLSKHRVRQIEKSALAKLRRAADASSL